MKQHFETVTRKMMEQLSQSGYEIKDEKYGDMLYSAVMANSEETVRVEYGFADKLFVLYRGEPGAASAEEMTRSQTYLFDEHAGDGEREAVGVANEFLETLGGQAGGGIVVQSQQKKKKKKDKDSDESTAEFFVNRIPSVLPECRDPLLTHKGHYGQLLPRWFCEEVVVPAVRKLISEGVKTPKARNFFQLVESMYAKGDLDTKAIIMQVIMPELADEDDIEAVMANAGDDFKKAFAAGKKFFGKEVKPEKVSAIVKAAQYQAETLRDMRG